MKFFQKRSVAVVLTLLIILASIGLGQVRRPVQSSPAPEPADPSALDTSLNTSGYTAVSYTHLTLPTKRIV